MKSIYVLLVSIIIVGCYPNNPGNKTIIFNNNSNEFVLINSSKSYPDSSLATGDVHNCSCEEVKAKSTCRCISLIGWEDEIAANKNKRIIFFVINNDSINKYGWSSVKDGNKFSKRYILTKAQLESMNWNISYP